MGRSTEQVVQVHLFAKKKTEGYAFKYSQHHCRKLLPTLRQNYRQSSMYRSYHSHIPSYLHDRPRSVIIYCLDGQTNSSKILAHNVHDTDRENGVFEVEKKSGNKHRVDFGLSRSEQMPYCTCKDWLRHHISCKHFFAIFTHRPASNGTTYLKLTCKVRISTQTPKHSKNAFNHPLTI